MNVYLYRYLTNTDKSQSSANKIKFKAIHHCFDTIGFKSQEINSIYSILAGILHLGNLEFVQDEGVHNDGKCQVSNKHLLHIIAQLFGVDEKEFHDALTQSAIVTRGETLVKQNSLQECVAARDSMSKGIYGRLFSWIVRKINLLLQPTMHE
jgi:myosin-3